MKICFCDWDARPAILVETPMLGMRAWAILDEDNPRWEEVDAADVFHTAYVMTEDDFWVAFPEAFSVREALKSNLGFF